MFLHRLFHMFTSEWHEELRYVPMKHRHSKHGPYLSEENRKQIEEASKKYTWNHFDVCCRCGKIRHTPTYNMGGNHWPLL